MFIWERVPQRIVNILIKKIIFHNELFNKINIGISFCQDNKISKLDHVAFFVIFIIHQWSGGIAIFIAIAIMIII